MILFNITYKVMHSLVTDILYHNARGIPCNNICGIFHERKPQYYREIMHETRKVLKIYS